MNDEAKVLYLKKLNVSLNEDITFLKVLLNKLDDRVSESRNNIYRLLNAYIEEKNRASVLLAQFDEETTENEEEKKEIFEQYFINKDIYRLSSFIFSHYQDDLLKIREILNSMDKESNFLTESFLHLTPIERMSLYQANMDYLDSK